MTEYLGADYADPPSTDPGWFASHGFSFACRYLPTGGARTDLTAQEVVALSRAGVGIVTIWETTGGDENYSPAGAAFFTAERGTREGGRAVAAARALGQPVGAPIYATVDFNARTDEDMAAILVYMQAFAAAIRPYPLGVYGSYAVIDLAQQLTPWLWQTYAWSAGKLHPKAVLHQFKNTQPFDYDRAFGDPGWWRPDGQPVQAAPAPPMERGGSTVPLTRSGDNGLAVKLLQTLLNAAGSALAPDGDFGPSTLAAVKDFQTKNGLTADGLVGPLTWDALAKITPAPRASQQDLNDMATQIQNLTNALGDANNRLAQVRSIVS
ncbi:MAG: glycoside hydrolase domain-containing protein [Symbiobacteriia bacterium]